MFWNMMAIGTSTVPCCMYLHGDCFWTLQLFPRIMTTCFCLLVWVSHSKSGISAYIVLEQCAWLWVVVSSTTTSSTTYAANDDDDNWWWPRTDTGESLPCNTRSQHICWLSTASSAASTRIELMSPPLVVLPHYVAHVALFATAIANHLVLNTCCCWLVSTLDLSKCNCLTWVLDWCISWYLYISIVDDHPSPSTHKLEHLNFKCIVWVLGLHFRLMHSDLFFASFVAAVMHQTCLVQWTWNILSIRDYHYPGVSDECDPCSSHPSYKNQPRWRRIPKGMTILRRAMATWRLRGHHSPKNEPRSRRNEGEMEEKSPDYVPSAQCQI